ncbi:hypothetical protein [Pontibacter harenae]|uniref:hypothetical protein n=1 Tax=Pontibacter harenae TaxID=2894083 RepID=UPI001E5243CA|nr:hypothetical protein [Pontibacter harenae]MCC9167653.1 hypothetical protein [Pontibacter harenae]
MKSYYDFKNDSPQERLERNSLYPELAKFHIALREELGEEEYQAFYQAEKEAMKLYAPMYHQTGNQRIYA